METMNPEAATADRELTVTRLLSAPRSLVFSVWTDPDRVTHWWGPNGFSVTVHSFDLRPGGVWSYTMHGPDGTDYPNRVQFIYREIVKPERLRYMHGRSEEEPDVFRVTVTFDEEEEGKKTRVTLHSIFPTAEGLQQAGRFGAVEGGNQTLSRLEKLLENMTAE